MSLLIISNDIKICTSVIKNMYYVCVHVCRRENWKIVESFAVSTTWGFMCWHQNIFHFIFQPKFLWLFAHIHAFTWCHYRNERMAWQEKTPTRQDETIAKTERKNLCVRVCMFARMCLRASNEVGGDKNSRNKKTTSRKLLLTPNIFTFAIVPSTEYMMTW